MVREAWIIFFHSVFVIGAKCGNNGGTSQTATPPPVQLKIKIKTRKCAEENYNILEQRDKPEPALRSQRHEKRPVGSGLCSTFFSKYRSLYFAGQSRAAWEGKESIRNNNL